MSYTELHADTQKLTMTPQGYTGYRKWRVSVGDIDDFIVWASRSSFPGYPRMRCVSVEMEGLTGGFQRRGWTEYSEYVVTANYSSAPWLNEPPQENIEFSLETFETGEGRTWLNAGTTMDSSMTIQNPTLTRTISFVSESIPLTAILSAVGKVNYKTFQGFPPETLLFLGATTDTAYRWESGDYVYRITYRFCWKRYGWNIVWRQPRQAIDDTGMPATDPLTGDPIWVDGQAGIGAWDRPVPALYDTTYFEPLFGRAIPGGGGGGTSGPYQPFAKQPSFKLPSDPQPKIDWLKST